MMADALGEEHGAMKTLTVLGSTGSIGTNTLDVVRRNRHLYQVYALVAGHNIELLAAQILEFQPKVAVVATSDGLDRLSSKLTSGGIAPGGVAGIARTGIAARVQIATAAEVDTVISAIVGVAGLEATYEAIRRASASGWRTKKCWFRAASW